MITIHQVIEQLELWAPRAYQEDYDNSGLLTGSSTQEVKGILVALDCTEAVVEEAIQLGCNLVIAHHPIVFRGLKRLTGKNYVERTVIKAIKSDVAIYAIHTNLDNVHTGVNRKIAEALGLLNLQVLAPKTHVLSKLVTFVPESHLQKVSEALHEAGAGRIGNYDNCSFQISGTGTYRPMAKANPFKGSIGAMERAAEVRIEMLLPSHLESRVVQVLRSTHPYEEVAYFMSRLENFNPEVGAGMVGELPTPEEPIAFLKRLKIVMNAGCIRHTPPLGKLIKRVAVCGGSGSFLLPRAIEAQADLFVSADFKYHEFFDADSRIVVADIGHYESEQYTKELIGEVLREKFPTFAINFSKAVTNPLSYI